MKVNFWSWCIQFIKTVLILLGISVVLMMGCSLYFRCDCGSEDEEAPLVQTTPSPTPLTLTKALP